MSIKSNETIRQLLMEDNKAVKTFIRNFEGGENDEKALEKLHRTLDFNKLGIPDEVQKKIDLFVKENIAPMVYDHETVFAEASSFGQMIDGVQTIDSEEESLKMCVAFIQELAELEKAWDDFAECELKKYLIG